MRLGDALRNVSGVSLTQQRGGVAGTFSARGFNVGVAGSGGLIISMVTKKPRYNWGGPVEMQAGSYGLSKLIVDVYGPITKNLAFRVMGIYENAKSFRDVVKSDRVHGNPSLMYKIDEKNDILQQADYQKSNLTPDAGIFYAAPVVGLIGRRRARLQAQGQNYVVEPAAQKRRKQRQPQVTRKYPSSASE